MAEQGKRPTWRMRCKPHDVGKLASHCHLVWRLDRRSGFDRAAHLAEVG
eukprot:CAMPEP_0204208450 /NCGR_PEP_ID=MMETSP0361-20130328/72501_1 /ASSEMBLY_ACC=CAM_ASM_000343 /TAXON_ID=268821 /ORGANISM="Scrippsiella Hangoei, Strain SHTV-5" /LENGTH=48 /DNA_ID= /DNA_START= /DNA_END= /DNA_ORIENTATION=